MCNLPSYEIYLGCGCTINTGFKYALQWCDAPNGIPFPDPEIFREEPGRVPGRACDEDRWTFSEVVMPGVCPQCEHDRAVRRDGPGVMVERTIYSCGHIRLCPLPATFHDYCRYNPEILVSPNRCAEFRAPASDIDIRARTQQGQGQGPNQEASDNADSDSDEQQPTVTCYYSRPEQKKNFSVVEEDLGAWHRERSAWVLDTERLRQTTFVKDTRTDKRCGNCDRDAWLKLWDEMAMDELEKEKTGYRKRAPRAIQVFLPEKKFFPDTVAVRCSPEPEPERASKAPPEEFVEPEWQGWEDADMEDA